jgi:hypothetical protein
MLGIYLKDVIEDEQG